jgi:hypothetical protein
MGGAAAGGGGAAGGGAAGGGGGGATATAACEKLADTSAVASGESSHGPIPWQAPDHPENTAPGPGRALRRTFVPGRNSTVQIDPQSTPAGSEVTDPSPLPLFATTILGPDAGAAAGGADAAGALDAAPGAQ